MYHEWGQVMEQIILAPGRDLETIRLEMKVGKQTPHYWIIVDWS